MVLPAPGQRLVETIRPDPVPGPGQVRLAVLACAVCRTDLHVVDGDLPFRGPVVPGHEIVGRVEATGPGVTRLALGDRVGVAWLGHACGHCTYCLRERENLCDEPAFTGWTRDGGYASHVLADAAFCFPLPEDESPEGLDDVHLAPLLCAGLIGWRAWRAAGGRAPGEPAVDLRELGLYGFGAAAHLLTQLAVHLGVRVHAFTRADDSAAQAFALRLGATWAGASDDAPPVELDAAILFAPAGELVPLALQRVRKGGRVVCGGIHMTDIPSFPYAWLWEEREVVSVANLTRRDGREFLAVARKVPLQVQAATWPLAQANEALQALRGGTLTGAAVLVP